MKLNRLLGAAFLLTFVAAGSALAQDKPAGTQPAGEKPSQPAADKPAQPANEKPAPKAEAAMVYVLMKTSMGDITLELNQEKAPVSVANFLSYVDKKHYDGLIFHRIMSNFMIQGGGHEPSMKERETGKPIKNEWKNGLKNVKYSLAMARKGGPTGADSATSQFYINVVDNPGLDRPDNYGAAYAVFGKVVAGFETVDKIKAVEVTGPERSTPVNPPKIESCRRMTAEEVSKLKVQR